MRDVGSHGRFLIAVGSSEYDDAQNFAPLNGVAEDLRRIITFFTSAVQGYVRVLADEIPLNASADTIRGAVNAWFASPERRASDQVVLYFAGHGDTTGRLNQHYLFTKTSDRNNLSQTAISADELCKWFLEGENERPQNLVVILDTCYSGKGAGQAAAVAAKADESRFDGTTWGLWIISSTRPTDEADDGGFVSALLEVINDLLGTDRSRPHFDPRDIVEAVNAWFEKWEFLQRAEVNVVACRGRVDFLRNPKFRPGIAQQELKDFRCDFSNEIALADGFVGRKEIFDFLTKFQTVNSRGYVRLTAGAGLGKTCLAAEVARRFGAPSFFANASRGLTKASQCLNHLSVAVIDRLKLPHDHLPPRAGEDSSFFEKMLKEAAEQMSGPLWLVVDALDEADEPSNGRNTLRLPQDLPERVYFFVTQRPGEYPLRTTPGTPLRNIEIELDSPMQRSDVCEFLRREAQHPEIASALQAFTPPVEQESFVAHLQKASEGNFMYLSYFLADLAAGELPFASIDSGNLPTGLHGYYEAIWSRMEALARSEGGEGWRSLYRPIRGLLVAAREPVTLIWLAELSGREPADIRERVLQTWRHILIEEGGGLSKRWRVLHRSFGDFLSEKLDLAEVHAKVAAHYRQPANWDAQHGYASRHLSTHLHLSGDIDGLCALVDDYDWYENQLSVDPTAIAYQADLFRAWSVAAAADMENATLGRPASWLGREIRSALITNTLNGFLAEHSSEHAQGTARGKYPERSAGFRARSNESTFDLARQCPVGLGTLASPAAACTGDQAC